MALKNEKKTLHVTYSNINFSNDYQGTYNTVNNKNKNRPIVYYL